MASPVQDGARPVHGNSPCLLRFHKELSVMDLPHILPDRQRTEPVLFGVFIHDDLRKTSLGEKTGKLVSIVDSHPINDRSICCPGVFPVRLIDDKKMPPGCRVRYTSRKLSVGPGQKYTVSNAVARSNAPSPKGRQDTSPCKIWQQPAWSPSRFTLLAFSRLFLNSPEQ